MSCGCKVVVRASYGDVYPHIIYCWQHSKNAEHATERRRYALLQAAAIIINLGIVGTTEAVNQAHMLLAEVERREKEEHL